MWRHNRRRQRSRRLRLSLRDREIILAGGTGGLGTETARMLTAEGARVISSYAHEAAQGGVRADITVPEDRARLLDQAKSLYGLVVFTGIAARAAKDWDESLAVNYTGPILLAREAA